MLNKTWDPKDAADHYRDYEWEGFAVVMATNACLFCETLELRLTVCPFMLYRLSAFWSLPSVVILSGALQLSGSIYASGPRDPRAQPYK